MSGRAGSTGALTRTQAVPACGVEKALLARRRMRGSTMLSWEKIDAIPGWFMFQSYCVWRARLDQPAVHRAIRSVGSEPVNIVPLSGPSADLPAKLDLKAMHQTVRWFHIDGEHTGTAVYRELEFANRTVTTDGIVVIDDFFSPRYAANTTEVIRYLEKNPFHFRLLAVGFNKGYLCRPESLPRYMDFMASGMSRALSAYGAKTTLFKTTGPCDTDAVGITDYVDDAGPIAGPDNEPQRWQMMRSRHVWSPWRHLQNGWRMVRSTLKS